MEYKVPELESGEQLIWVGQPEAYKDYRDLDRVLLPVSGLLLAFSTLLAAYTAFSVASYGFHVYHAITLVIWLLVGGLAVYSYFLRFLVKRRGKEKLVYGITSAGRVMIRDMKTLDIHDYIGAELEEAYISEIDRNGTGTIYLTEEKHLFDNTGLSFFTAANSRFIALYDVADAEKVLAIIQGEAV